MRRTSEIFYCLCTLGLLVCTLSGAQSDRTKGSNTMVRRRIIEIVRQRLNEGVITVNGVQAQTRTPPSPEVVNEIKHYGDSGVVVLAEYLHSRRRRERITAVELLGVLGGARIVGPLRGVILHDPSAMVRELALRWLTQAPSDLAQPIIREAARTDPDERVRTVAKSILQLGTSSEDPKISVPFRKVSPHL